MAAVEKPASPVPLDTIPISPEGSNIGGEENVAPNGGAKKSDSEEVTVFHDPENFNVKHPLMHQWTLWFTKPPSGKVGLILQLTNINSNTNVHTQGDNWNDLLKEVVTFDSVEEFWGVYVSRTPSLTPNPPTPDPRRTTSRRPPSWP